MQTAGGNPDNFVSDGHTRSVNQLRILYNAYSESSQIVLPFFIKPRHFSRLTADERTVGFGTPFNDPRNHLDRLLGVKFG